ncbi:hypothetical protein E2C01_099005 [Portunus trituberculatus]|uniref:Uncharacterized protein n=1 Tax=Portunus trituberculatus TaxID=210409 RepID=A0A5B7KEA5_PORTR|nr:hypothetical protein [Portunus trituberculatus]
MIPCLAALSSLHLIPDCCVWIVSVTFCSVLWKGSVNVFFFSFSFLLPDTVHALHFSIYCNAVSITRAPVDLFWCEVSAAAQQRWHGSAHSESRWNPNLSNYCKAALQ